VRHSRQARFAAAALLALAPGCPALAQANRVFASARTGSDLNSCGNINTPCQTLQAAVDQVAAGGVVLILDSGGYGPVQILKALTIEVPTGVEAFLHPPAGSAVGIAAGGSDVVVLRGLTLTGGTSAGIFFVTGQALHVENCRIEGFRDGIVANGGGVTVYDLFVEDTVIRDSTDSAIEVGEAVDPGTVRVTIERCLLVGNTRYGFDCFDTCVALVSGSLAAGNGAGLSLAGSSAGVGGQLTIDRSLVANNRLGGVLAATTNGASETVRISNSSVTGNGTGGGLRQDGAAQLLSRSNNTVEGNTPDEVGAIGAYSPK